MTASDYEFWLRRADRYSRRADEAEDLLQDALLIAAENGRLDFSLEENRRWFTGVLRNRAAMTARSAGRRRVREGRAAASMIEYSPPEFPVDEAQTSFLRDLPPSSRMLATLILHGMTRTELLYVLKISPAAYRQRLTAIRRRLRAASPAYRTEELALAFHRRPHRGGDLERGLIRRALLNRVRRSTGVGSHDPDGHLFVLSSTEHVPNTTASSHIDVRRQR